MSSACTFVTLSLHLAVITVKTAITPDASVTSAIPHCETVQFALIAFYNSFEAFRYNIRLACCASV